MTTRGLARGGFPLLRRESCKPGFKKVPITAAAIRPRM